MTSAVFSFAGVESIAMAAAETQNPRRAIPRACKQVFIRVLLFYMLAVLIVGMLVASDDPRLGDESGTAAQSPFVIAASAAGIRAIPSLVNAIVITSAWSSSNQSLLAGTRVLYGLALKGQAPKIFLRTTTWGTPYVCVALFTVFMLLSFFTLNNDALTVFYWLMDLTAAGVLVSWSAILFNHIRMKWAMKKQGIPVARLPWHNSWSRKYFDPCRPHGTGFCYVVLTWKCFFVYSIQLVHLFMSVYSHPPDERLQCLHQGKLGYRDIRVKLLVSNPSNELTFTASETARLISMLLGTFHS